MSINVYTIVSVINGALNKVTLTQTGLETLSAETKVWNAGSNPDNPPDHDTNASLANCKSNADGTVLSADVVGILFLKPHIAITLTKAATTPPTYLMELDVTGAVFANSDKTAPVSASNYTGFVSFIKACGFPLLT
jgi:hypothetical protein